MASLDSFNTRDKTLNIKLPIKVLYYLSEQYGAIFDAVSEFSLGKVYLSTLTRFIKSIRWPVDSDTYPLVGHSQWNVVAIQKFDIIKNLFENFRNFFLTMNDDKDNFLVLHTFLEAQLSSLKTMYRKCEFYGKKNPLKRLRSEPGTSHDSEGGPPIKKQLI
uniref:Bromo domain-containing protein n=1 Tax=Meloidogyne hapla TaxID=6305 RepID=A0A1I8BC18_MELHA